MLALFLSVAMATLPLAAGTHDNVAPARDRSNESATRIKELQKQQIATLKELAAVSMKLYQSARASYDEALDAQVQLLRAELDAADKAADRIALYKDFVEVMKGYEKLAAAQKEAGRGTSAAVLKFRAKRLEAEIQLERTIAKAVK
jgi:hypothetical protein